MSALIKFKPDELEALRAAVEASAAQLDARRLEALRRAQWKLDQPRKQWGKLKKPRATDPAYKRWIRGHPCLVCGATQGVEAAHTGPHGVGIKSDDRTCLPLCRTDHRTGRNSYHQVGPRQFEQAHGLRLAMIVARLNAEYEGLREYERQMMHGFSRR
jgi:hypothetical protein